MIYPIYDYEFLKEVNETIETVSNLQLVNSEELEVQNSNIM